MIKMAAHRFLKQIKLTLFIKAIQLWTKHSFFWKKKVAENFQFPFQRFPLFANSPSETIEKKSNCFFQLALCRPTKNFCCWKFPQVFFLILWKLAKASFRKKGDFGHEKFIQRISLQKLPPSNFEKIQKWCLEIFNFRKQGELLIPKTKTALKMVFNKQTTTW